MQYAEMARVKAYAPYSGFYVGAALLTASGKVYTGCNIENAAFSPTNCAERTAFFKAVSDGERSFAVIAVVGGQKDTLAEICTPCGVCRQVMAEFCDKDFEIVLGNSEKFEIYHFSELLPHSFSKKDIQ